MLKKIILVTSCRKSVSQNNPQCLLLNIPINSTRDIFGLPGMKTQNMDTQESKEIKFKEKVRKKRVSSSNIYIAVCAFLF